MSDLTTLIAMTFLVAVATFLYYYIHEKVNRIGDQILTGLVQGTPVSMRARQAMLFQMWAPYQTGAISVAVFFAFAALEIADHVGDTEVKMLAYFATFIFAIGAVMTLTNLLSGFFQYRSLLHHAESKRA
jgi:acyl-coenzyme A synthetase/AMP-(fatty) acid ligase